jgi:hypothetical protein
MSPQSFSRKVRNVPVLWFALLKRICVPLVDEDLEVDSIVFHLRICLTPNRASMQSNFAVWLKVSLNDI